MKKILCIGNSFSQDATHFLHQIGEAAGVESKVVNLCIGGCSLERHYKTITNEIADYEYELNGVWDGEFTTLSKVLAEEEWDIITIQQASHESGWLDAYEPFAGHILAYLKEKAPNAKIMLHQTWAYAKVCNHPNYPRYNCNQQEMYQKVIHAYTTISEKYGIPMIPNGRLVQKLRETEVFSEENGTAAICRDGFHMSYVYGRYAVACMFAKVMFGIKLEGNSYIPQTTYAPDFVSDEQILAMIRKTVDEFE